MESFRVKAGATIDGSSSRRTEPALAGPEQGAFVIQLPVQPELYHTRMSRLVETANEIAIT